MWDSSKDLLVLFLFFPFFKKTKQNKTSVVNKKLAELIFLAFEFFGKLLDGIKRRRHMGMKTCVEGSRRAGNYSPYSVLFKKN